MCIFANVSIVLSTSEENYLKAVLHLSEGKLVVSTNEIAKELNTKASSATDMVQKLSDKGLLYYKKYKGAQLTKKGEKLGLSILRKHRLWEVFLVDHLGFKWDEINDVAEQLEHVRSEKLVERLDAFLNYPQFDPHGDPIPDAEGNLTKKQEICLEEVQEGINGRIVSLNDSSSDFLKYLDNQRLNIGTKIVVKKIHSYDGSMDVLVNENKTITISQRVAKNININEEA